VAQAVKIFVLEISLQEQVFQLFLEAFLLLLGVVVDTLLLRLKG
jgi:hypothetical protein